MKVLPKGSDSIFLPRAKCPEDLGICSAAITQTLRELDEKGIHWHTFMLIRRGTVAAECIRFPFRNDFPHCMYSISKNITALALGFAVTEGLLTLDDRVLDYFPEYEPTQPSQYDDKLESLTVRNLVNMTSGKRPSYLLNKTEADWLPHFFDAKWKSAPGEEFEYVNENPHILCTILQKVTGQTVIEYLQERLWEPLGIRTPFWETDHKGVESGGWGIILSPESMAKIFVCIQQGGVFNGKQVLPAAYLQEAIVDQTHKIFSHGDAKKDGYGYSFWRQTNEIYCGEGMYGQIAAIHEKSGLLCIFTGGETRTGEIWNAIHRVFDTCLSDAAPDAAAQEELRSFIAQEVTDVVPQGERSRLEPMLQGQEIVFEGHRLLDSIRFPMSVIPLPGVYMTRDRAGNITDVSFEFRENSCLFSWREGDEYNTVECGMDGRYRYTKGLLASHPFTFAGAAAWLDTYTLRVELRPMECLAKRTMDFVFSGGGRVEMTPTMTPPISIMVDSVAGYVRSMAKSAWGQKLADTAMKKLEALVEPLHTGTLQSRH